MTQIDKEKILDKYSLPVTIDETEIILNQMKHSICKIENKNGNGTGFFCQISNKKLLITNNHVINEKIIKENNIIRVQLNDNKIKKNIKVKDYYTSEKYDTTIIEINANDENINYLEIDDDIFDENINIYNKSIYIIQYPKYGNEQKAAVSYGLLNEIQDKYNIIHYCSTDHGSSGSPIIKLSNKKIIGIHKESVSKFDFNRGTLLKYPINEYLNKNNQINENNIINKNNEINLLIKIENEDINKNIYFLDNTDGNYDDGEHHHDNLKELNELNTEIFINDIKYKYSKSFMPEKEGLYRIKIKFNIKIKDCNYMFFGCSKLTTIDLSSFDTKNVINMSNMFSWCSNLKNINFSSFDTKNVKNMYCMFYRCSNLKNIDISSFDTNNVSNMSYMFFGCSNLTSIDLSSFSTKNVNDLSLMFSFCTNLKSIDLSSFDTKNVINMSHMFFECSNLKNINLSSFDTKNVKDMFCMLSRCSNLTNIDLSSFDTNNIENMNGMFLQCSKLNKVKINNISSNIIKEIRYTDANIIDQFGNNISKNNYANNDLSSNNFNNNNLFNYNNENNNIFNNMNNYMNNNNMINNLMNNNMINYFNNNIN